MKTIYQHIDDLTIQQWHYYFGIDSHFDAKKPFINNSDYTDFIYNYFKRGGKVKVFELSNINPEQIRLPNHICSVFFLGILLYNGTKKFKKYKLKNNSPDYATFPFIWFLIALFHDNAYQMENKNQLKEISTIQDLLNEFDIEHFLFDKKFSRCKELLNSRNNYFLFRKKKYDVVDHGILGGLLLFDRLVKIRREKKSKNEDQLFWGRRLENQYKTAANAISIHNIWLQTEKICSEFNLNELSNFKPIKFLDFPLFYILGIVDTIEPLKTYKDSNLTDIEILNSINLEFGEKTLRVSESKNSKIHFSKICKQTENFEDWLDIDIKIENNYFELQFK